ncbi:MAG: hypothetical protein ACRC8J_05815, partial [Phocaeicola sp.]
MKLTFQIYYHTNFGETLLLTIKDYNTSICLSSRDGYFWEGTINTDEFVPNSLLTYQYSVYSGGVCTRIESAYIPHTVCLNHLKRTTALIQDTWNELPADSYLYSSAFYKGLKPSSMLSVSSS